MEDLCRVMDEILLNDLLECSVCLERLDTSSKVLPCQHTFCKKCLEEILSTKHELRCPECRILVTTAIDSLPPNVLLMRILEGMRHAGNEPKKKQSPEQNTPAPLFAYNPKPPAEDPLIPTPLPKHSFLARALYDYQSLERGDLCFNKGDIITIRTKIDVHWAQGECSGRTGIFPLTFVKVITPEPIATCRALYDFKMNNDEVEGCLSFRKDEVLSVIRRVDENWIEGRLRNRVGIFPLAFVEMNHVAKALMKLSFNELPGPSRLAPPTPSSGETTPLIPTQVQNLILSPTPEKARPQTPRPISGPRAPVSDSSSTTPNSSCTSNTTSSNSSSTGSSSPASPQQQTTNLNPFIRPQTILLPTSHITTQARDKRHSFTAVTSNAPPVVNSTNRHSAEILSSGEAQGQETNPSCEGAVAQTSNCGESVSNVDCDPLVRQGSQRHRRSNSDFPAVTLPAHYVALYPYKPLKVDELELKKGGVYLVTERCQDGWFKGTSNRTQKTGVFPGNYVTLAKPAPSSKCRVVTATPREISTTKPKGLRQPFQSTLAPPELPPRANSPAPAPRPLRHPPPNPSTSEPEITVVSSSPAVKNPTDQTHLYRLMHANHVSPPPNVTLAPSPLPVKSAEKVKEKKEKTGLMKRLAAIKRSKSPTVPAYSMDNPVFEDSSVPSSTAPSTAHAAHSRSGSCPSQLMQLPVGTAANHHRPMSASLSARVTKQKERPSVAAAQFSHALSRVSDVGPPGSQPLAASHRKSSSLDAGDTRNPKHIVPSVRERFRCIVPYPPNSEYELELRVGDIIYVHRKRDDGWYKGTLQRTGRTGLFPASFVETFF